MRKTLTLQRILGIEQIQALLNSYREESREISNLKLRLWHMIFFFFLVVSQIVFVATFNPKSSKLVLVSVVTGILVLLGLIFRNRIGIRLKKVDNWRKSLSTVHVAFALGCIPTVILAMIDTEMFAKRITSLSTQSGPPVLTRPSVFELLCQISFMIVTTSAWASVTEEVLFRGVLVSVLRRFSFFTTQFKRDFFAVMLSSLLFGFAHYSNWGLFSSLALTGLGLGFGFGYLAVGERLTPLIIYHFIFDFISLSIAVAVFVKF